MKIFFIGVVSLFLSQSSFAQFLNQSSLTQSQKGFVKIASDRELYVDYIQAKPGQPTLVILNGLTYTTESWNKMIPNLVDKGFGILRYDAFGQGQTLKKYAPILNVIKIEDQARDLAKLLQVLKINRASFLGLSYGGGLAIQFAAMYPQHVDKLILMAPYVGPLPSQDAAIKMQIEATRKLYPYNPYSDDQLYDYFLKINVYTTFPLAEPVLMGHPLAIEAVFRMSQGIRKMDVQNLIKFLPPGSVHFIVAGQDQYIPASEHNRFWMSLEPSKKVSRLDIIGSEHKIPEAVPVFSASWVVEIMKKNPAIKGGKSFLGNPFLGLAKCGNLLIKLKKEYGFDVPQYK